MSHYDFTSIAVGDTVMICGNRGRSLHKVAKVTKTQFAIESGTRFMRDSGRQYGGGMWDSLHASIPNADDIAAVHAEQRQRRATDEHYRLLKQIGTALQMITGRRAEGWGPTIEASNDHLRRALEALQAKRGELL